MFIIKLCMLNTKYKDSYSFMIYNFRDSNHCPRRIPKLLESLSLKLTSGSVKATKILKLWRGSIFWSSRLSGSGPLMGLLLNYMFGLPLMTSSGLTRIHALARLGDSRHSGLRILSNPKLLLFLIV